jgi:hypothetical protein
MVPLVQPSPFSLPSLDASDPTSDEGLTTKRNGIDKMMIEQFGGGKKIC